MTTDNMKRAREIVAQSRKDLKHWSSGSGLAQFSDEGYTYAVNNDCYLIAKALDEKDAQVKKELGGTWSTLAELKKEYEMSKDAVRAAKTNQTPDTANQPTDNRDKICPNTENRDTILVSRAELEKVRDTLAFYESESPLPSGISKAGRARVMLDSLVQAGG